MTWTSPAAPKGKSGIPAANRHSEDNTVCHQVRDGVQLPVPALDQKCGVVIIGGGPSGLAAADELKSSDFLLLEKEDQLGGNSYSENWQGLDYSTAAAWDSLPVPEFVALAERFKLDWKKIEGEDSVSFDGKWIRNLRN
jgi:NADPH-dependent 2,4-dienoyl-CoA reductase/sulfur reductase-like enzyme